MIKELYWKIIPFNYRPGELWYKFKCWAWHRYTTVKPRYLGHTWVDRDVLLAHTMFEILSKYVEKELGEEKELYEERDGINNQLRELYKWWNGYYNHQYELDCEAIWSEAEKHIPISEWEEFDDGVFEWCPKWSSDDDRNEYNQAMAKLSRLEESVQSKLLENMHKLVNLSPWMWT